MSTEFNISCPVASAKNKSIQLAHGGGGTLMHRLLNTMFLPAFKNDMLDEMNDGAVLRINDSRLAFTTDSFVVHPLFFPGGDIGTLAINGTVNDLAMCGAQPLFLSAGFIIEEGLPMDTLQVVVNSMKSTAASAGVQLVTGDTKVVDHGKGDGVYINTAGIGVIEHGLDIGPSQVRVGDAVILSGDLGRHGISIMAVREGLEFETTIESDCASLAEMVLSLLKAGIEIHCMRDLTRGGLASALVEISEVISQRIHIHGPSIPVDEQVQGACEILGLDPTYVANEGRMVLFVSEEDVDAALEILRNDSSGAQACLIGHIEADSQPLVTIESEIGATRIMDMLSGEQLPRIC